MKVSIIAIVTILMFGLCAGILIRHWVIMSSDRNDLDRISVLLEPIKDSTSANMDISFLSNLQEPELSKRYFQCQFALAPRVLTTVYISSNPVLIVESKNNDVVKYQDHTDTVFFGRFNEMKFLLVQNN